LRPARPGIAAPPRRPYGRPGRSPRSCTRLALERIREQGVTCKLVGIEAPGDPSFFEITEARPALVAVSAWGASPTLPGRRASSATSGVCGWPAELADPGNDLEIEWKNGERSPAKTAAIPFLDSGKTVPTG
jgi:hypothetical protein